MSDSVQLIHAAQAGNLPAGWSSATIEGLVGKEGVFVDGDWVESKDQDPTGDVRLIQLADIGDGEYRNRSDRFLTHEKALELGCTFLNKDDILIARMPDPLGRACLFPGDRKKSVTVVDVAIVRSGKGEFNHRWLMYFINAPAFRTSVASLQSGSTRKRISRGNLARISLPVPPRRLQDSIVAEIEKQFSRLDEAVANLKRVKANLKRYKAAVLKAAVEGKLTEDWRKQHPNVEPASKLLERILTERRKKWTGRANFKELIAPEVADLPSLPKGWMWASLEMVGQHDRPIIYGIIKPGPHIPNGVPYVRVTEMKNGWVDVKNLRRTSPERAAKFARATLASGDVLISKDGTIGRVAVVPPELKGGNITQHVMRAPVNSLMVRDFVVWAIRSDFCQKWLTGETRGVALQGVNVEDFRRLPVPIPPYEEQAQIVAEVERRLSVIDELEAAVEANLTRADRLRQSILSQAFSGKLSTVDAKGNGQRSTDIDRARA